MNIIVYDGATAEEPWIHSDVYMKIQRHKLKVGQIEYETLVKVAPIKAKNAKVEKEVEESRNEGESMDSSR